MKFAARLQNVTHRYGDITALDNATIDIPSGRMVGFIGPDGVGKSTALALISGVRKIQSGSVEVLGGDMRNSRFRDKTCPRIAYMPQGLGKNLYMSLSVYENVEFFGRLFGLSKAERTEKISMLLKSTGLAQFKDRAAGKLSGGMKQKLGLCCALIHEPELLILDEPTTGVDPLSRKHFWDLINNIRSRRKDMSVIIATAYMEEAAGFDWIVAMDEGKILSSATPSEIMTDTGTDNLDTAFIELLPEEKRKGHQTLHVPHRETDGEQTAITAENLTMRFGNFIAVDNVSFRIEKGEIFGFLGSNGCGKTTTMKMLTGLLTPTEGRSWLFNRELNSHETDIRSRVGYMTQSFSLYAELTVAQNLRLHAKLYHIPPDTAEKRAEELIQKFDLKQYINTTASNLPLGIKQRLSLAVAIIHKPEMLILDEPTSGVDPISRDVFWELLIDLSRNEKVTIFVSTHYMNEGERCDRISLMHQGKVLDSDRPSELIRKRGKDTLEEAFIDFLQETESEAQTPEESLPKEHSTEVKRYGYNSFFSLRRMLGYTYRESLELMRDPIRLIFALAGMVILMFIMGYGITLDVENMSFAALDEDNSPESRAYLQNISGSRYFSERNSLRSFAELEKRMKTGELNLAVVIPPGFGADILKGNETGAAVWIDGSMPFRAETIRGYVRGMHYKYLAQMYRERFGADASLDRISLEMRYRYNPDFKSIYAMVPAVIPMLLILIPAILMTLSVVREKELGSITNFYATPVTKIEFVIGKQLPYIAISMLSFFGLVILAVYVFGVSLKGNLFLLTFGALLYVTVTTGIGLMISSFTKTQIAALAVTAIATLLPTVSFSGIKDPVSSLQGAGAVIGKIFPATYFVIISRGLFNKALRFSDLYREYAVLTVSVLVITLLSILLLKKQEK